MPLRGCLQSRHGFYSGLFLLLMLLCSHAASQAAWNSFESFPPIKTPYHPVTTDSPEAQAAFNKGLAAIYAFNYDMAVSNFDLASQHDPHCAMAYWGMALAIDQTLDPTTTLNHAQLTMLLTEKALSLSKLATPKEQAYIRALATRFSPDPNADRKKLRSAYSTAMGKVAEQYPDDLDALTLYAESIMDDIDWNLWKDDGKPAAGTERVVHILESVLRRNPYHLGANHYYIHALENSPFPTRALAASFRLDSLDLREWGHLIHTTSHIYLHLGYYDLSAKANEAAVKADKEYIKKNGLDGRYPLKYLAHNLYYLTATYACQERYPEALATAIELEELVRPYAADAAFLEYNLMEPLEMYLYFHKWGEILKVAEPARDFHSQRLFWRFARAMAYSALNQNEEALEAENLFYQDKKALLANSKGDYTKNYFDMAEYVLQAAIARSQKKYSLAITLLEKAKKIERELGHFVWYHPIAQTLGAVYIENQQLKEAEAVFREVLTELPRNGRSLFGLYQTLKLQGKEYFSVERECVCALQLATQPLSLKDL